MRRRKRQLREGVAKLVSNSTFCTDSLGALTSLHQPPGDNCRKSKCKCARILDPITGKPAGACENCLTAGTECKFEGATRKRFVKSSFQVERELTFCSTPLPTGDRQKGMYAFDQRWQFRKLTLVLLAATLKLLKAGSTEWKPCSVACWVTKTLEHKLFSENLLVRNFPPFLHSPIPHPPANQSSFVTIYR